MRMSKGCKTYGNEDIELIRAIGNELKESREQRKQRQQKRVTNIKEGYIIVSCPCGYWTQEKIKDKEAFQKMGYEWLCPHCHKAHKY